MQMTRREILFNARLVLPGEVLSGHVVLQDGIIAEIGTGPVSGGTDCGGDHLAPGLIELHTDNLERHIAPRPGVDWPHHAAIVAHDAELAGTGITTVFDALRVGSIQQEGSAEYRRYVRPMATKIMGMRRLGALRINHHLHLRAETCSETLIAELDEFGADDDVRLISLMYHTPGQRQFSDLSKLEVYVRGKHALDEAGFRAHCAYLEGLYAAHGPAHEAATVAAARRLGAVLASHDDSTAGHVAISARHGVTVAEFPTTALAARACRDAGIAVMMGAPNLIRGGSHSGNVSAGDLADAGLLDILSSDYVPAALLMGAVMLGQRWGNMARGLATVTGAPAQVSGLTDRGRIAPGLRADLVRFSLTGTVPVTRGVWVGGARVA